MLRELVRIVGERLNRPVSFTPLRDPDGVGNGVHIHMSFVDEDGRPATYDPESDTGLSRAAGSFVAGILARFGSLVVCGKAMAILCPAFVSFVNSPLQDTGWSPTFAVLKKANPPKGGDAKPPV